MTGGGGGVGKGGGSVNRRNFIKKILGAGAALYVPEKTYGFLFPDKCESWWQSRTFASCMAFNGSSEILIPYSPEARREADRLVTAFNAKIPATVWTLANSL